MSAAPRATRRCSSSPGVRGRLGGGEARAAAHALLRWVGRVGGWRFGAARGVPTAPAGCAELDVWCSRRQQMMMSQVAVGGGRWRQRHLPTAWRAHPVCLCSLLGACVLPRAPSIGTCRGALQVPSQRHPAGAAAGGRGQGGQGQERPHSAAGAWLGVRVGRLGGWGEVCVEGGGRQRGTARGRTGTQVGGQQGHGHAFGGRERGISASAVRVPHARRHPTWGASS